MNWTRSNRADPRARVVADRHYNRQKVGAPQFVPPGRCIVLLTPAADALWVTSWPFTEYVKHAWAGAWMCSCFRREGGAVSASALIREACAATRAIYGEPPPLGLVTFLDRSKVRPTRVRGEDVWGWTWMKAGFRHVGFTKAGLMAFQLAPEDFPEPMAPLERWRAA
jgi:hypothetical protein